MPVKARKKQEIPCYGECAWEGCGENAHYPAPKERLISDEVKAEKIYFCLDHVREYNKSWDFFDGMSGAEIEKFQKDAVTGHRKTKKIREYKFVFDDALFDLDLNHTFANSTGTSNNSDSLNNYNILSLSNDEKEALAVFNLENDTTLDEIKLKYKTLVKQYHPDINVGDKELEEKFKIINEAYDILKNSEFFCSKTTVS